jgi:succinate dehydrogenase / fumarate reductase iron-sulfur subunit
VRINGQPALACHTHLDKALKGAKDGVIEVEPMGNMPIIKDLIVDMDAVHWKKIQRVTPWLINKLPIPEREYIVPHQNMVDVTQSMACIQCGACVSDCLSMEVDPLFIGPAALAKAYRFAGDPRDAQQFERVKDLAEDPHGIFDCTHCFKCIEACPKGVAPMNQIMRLRRIATGDHHISDRNNGERHESAFVTLVRNYGLLWEAELLPRSHGGDNFFGKFAPKAGLELLDSLPVIAKGLLRRKVTPGKAIFPPKEVPKDARAQIKSIFEKVEGRAERRELNLYITGYDEDLDGAETASASSGPGTQGQPSAESGQPGMSPEESPTR